MPNEKLEKLKREQYVAEKKLTAAKHKEKRLESEIKRLTRSERTHRLCTRAGMLETFLREPTILTDDDVMEFLTFIFHSEAVQKKLNNLALAKYPEYAQTVARLPETEKELAAARSALASDPENPDLIQKVSSLENEVTELKLKLGEASELTSLPKGMR